MENNPTPYENNYNADKPKVGIGLLIVSFLFPLIGVILYFVKKEKVSNPKDILKWAGVSFALGVIGQILTMAVA